MRNFEEKKLMIFSELLPSFENLDIAILKVPYFGEE